jgi:hypothetical protein
MKLYKLFEEVIFEMLGKSLLTENVSDQDVIDAINGKYNVNITYDDYPDSETLVPPSKRYIQVYNFAETKAGNKAIRAYQIFGGSKTTPKQGAWKIFRLDRIRSWAPTKVKWKRPVSDLSPSIPAYNKDGDRTMGKVFNKVDVNNVGPYKPKPNASKEIPRPKLKPKVNQAQIKQPKPVAKQQSSYISKEDPKPAEPVNTSITTAQNNKKQNKL